MGFVLEPRNDGGTAVKMSDEVPLVATDRSRPLPMALQQRLFWKPDQVNEFFKLALPNTARDLDLHPDGLRVATAHHDGKVRVSLMRPKPA